MTVHAVVRVGSTETSYVRAGRGAPVVLLAAGTGAMIAAGVLFARLAREFRVVAPVFDPDPRDRKRAASPSFLLRLRDVLEGLGMERPVLVAERSWEPILAPASRAGASEGAAVVFYGPATDDPSLEELVRLLRIAVDARTHDGA